MNYLTSWFNKSKIIKTIEGSDCATNPELCFNRVGNRYATVKDDVEITVYKQTNLLGARILTTLKLPPKTKVHLCPNAWTELFGGKNLNDPSLNKCRAEKARVIKMETINHSAPVQEPIQESVSHNDPYFVYQLDNVVKSSTFFDENCFANPLSSACNTNFVDLSSVVCRAGIHFFFDKKNAEEYRD